MSVYTELGRSDIEALLLSYRLGDYQHHQGITAGVENTNYFVTTTQQKLVLTLFEKHPVEELPFFFRLGEHLHQHQCKVPLPLRDKQGDFLQFCKGKPAVFIERVAGQHLPPAPAAAAEIAAALAHVHKATESFTEHWPHSRDRNWIKRQHAAMTALLATDEQELLAQANRIIDDISTALPQGVIHGDLFHDNALFEAGHITAIIDWYFAGIDSYALDVAITMNDWCLTSDGLYDPLQGQLFLTAYQHHRALSAAELAALPDLQIQSACRFWMSRQLAQAANPHAKEDITVKDPGQMKQLLQQLLTLRPAKRNP